MSLTFLKQEISLKLGVLLSSTGNNYSDNRRFCQERQIMSVFILHFSDQEWIMSTLDNPSSTAAKNSK